jgi:hypothetical protein
MVDKAGKSSLRPTVIDIAQFEIDIHKESARNAILSVLSNMADCNLTDSIKK